MTYKILQLSICIHRSPLFLKIHYYQAVGSGFSFPKEKVEKSVSTCDIHYPKNNHV
nr:MAG TPA: hypothetical protein [Caudoviricetes sp.]